MTQIKSPYLILRRLLIITHTGSIAYDEAFHAGVNIIRGDNGSGKSTISNFIFFVLGGDFNNWTTEASQCREVFAEVEITGKVLTLRRYISDSARQSMDIFIGNIDDAKKDSVTWQRYPYNQTENKDSYSTVLFKALGIPEARTEEENKITIHQILRFLYIDQDSPVQNLIRFELFDKPLIREATGELLFGTYDETLYSDRIQLRDKKKKLEEKSRELKVIKEAFVYSGNKISLTEIERDIAGQNLVLNNIISEINELKQKSYIPLRLNSKTNIEKIQEDIVSTNEELVNVYEEVQFLNNQILDSKLFVDSIKKRLKAVEESIQTRKILGNLPLVHCPQCLGTLPKRDSDDLHCSLCHEAIEPGDVNTHAFRIKQEFDIQIKESNHLLENKEKRYKESLKLYNSFLEKSKLLKKDLNLESKNTSTVRDDKLDELYTNKGIAERNIEFLNAQKQNALLIQDLIKEIGDLERDVSTITGNIKIKELNQKENLFKVSQAVEKYAKSLLKSDGGYQEEFDNPYRVVFNIRDDVFSLDGKFNFSASSNIYLKNSIRFSFSFASNDLDLMRYPRFILCDNIEDKGMQQKRSQNFQKLIVALSKASDVSHQIILTTSMVDPELNTDKSICIGDYYTKASKTLKNVRGSSTISNA